MLPEEEGPCELATTPQVANDTPGGPRLSGHGCGSINLIMPRQILRLRRAIPQSGLRQGCDDSLGSAHTPASLVPRTKSRGRKSAPQDDSVWLPTIISATLTIEISLGAVPPPG
jgi:hypothetical protein